MFPRGGERNTVEQSSEPREQKTPQKSFERTFVDQLKYRILGIGGEKATSGFEFMIN